MIAAREKIDCTLEEYLNIIRSEFSRRTIGENQNKLLINLRGRVPMTTEEIELGIEMGLVMLEKRIESQQQAIQEPQNLIENAKI